MAEGDKSGAIETLETAYRACPNKTVIVLDYRSDLVRRQTFIGTITYKSVLPFLLAQARYTYYNEYNQGQGSFLHNSTNEYQI